MTGPRRHRSAWLAILVLMAVTILVTVVQGQPEVDSSTQKLQGLRQEIKTIRDELAELSNQREFADQALKQVTREIGLVKELLAGLDQREALLSRQRDDLQVRLVRQNETYELRRQALAERLRALYKQGPQHDLELILTSQSFSSLVARLKFNAMLARVDGNLVEQTRQQALTIEVESKQLQAALAGIWEAREEAQQENERLGMLEVERRGLLREVASESDRATTELSRLKRQEKQLTDLLARLETQRQEQPDVPSRGIQFTNLQGDLPWPATGSVTREFGRNIHPRFGTITMHNGLTIATTVGAPIYAVAAGKVEFADHLPGFGRCVILDHGSGHYTLYANLARIFVGRGSEISGGQVLAEMGEATDTGHPEFYFEVREGRDARDPRAWLRPAH